MGVNKYTRGSSNDIALKYVGVEYGQFIINRFVGRYVKGLSKNERDYFERMCKFCGVKNIINTSKIGSDMRKPPMCKCKGGIEVTVQTEKKCNTCKEVFPLTSEYFHKNRSRPNGLCGECKTCQNLRTIKLRLKRRPKEPLFGHKFLSRIESDVAKLKEEFLGKEFGSFVVINYVGRYTTGKAIHPRYHFEKECKFCGVKTTQTASHLRDSIKRGIKCNLCKESLNIHTKERICRRCERWLPATNEYFSLSKNRPFGIHYYCFPCGNEKRQKRRELKENRDKEYAQKKARMETDIIFKMSVRIRTHIKNYVNKKRNENLPATDKRTHGKSEMIKVLGGDYKFFKEWIENQFTEGMTWDNYGEWHYEHIIPLSYVNTVDEIYELCHHTNYRPMWGGENISKGDKLHIDEISEENKVRYAKFIDRYINNPKYVRYAE
jgi:hypothetical protein